MSLAVGRLHAAGFTLQSTTNLVSPAVRTAVSPTPVVADGQNAVTNPISGTRKFYRLARWACLLADSRNAWTFDPIGPSGQSSEHAKDSQALAKFKTLVGIKIQQPRRGAASRGDAPDAQPLPDEVPCPSVTSRIEQTHDTICVRVNGRQIRALAFVASGHAQARLFSELEPP